jgi:hypothetical protein
MVGVLEMTQMPKNEAELETWLVNAYNAGYQAGATNEEQTARIDSLKSFRKGMIAGMQAGVETLTDHPATPNAVLDALQLGIKRQRMVLETMDL